MNFQTSKWGDYIKKRNDQYTDEWFKKKIYSMRDDIEIISKYETKYSDIICRCKKHPHHTFSCKAYTLLNGNGKCKICRFESRNLIDRTFGRLTVIELDEELSLKKKSAHWKCQCQCGNTISVLQAALLNGNTTSCGCAKIDATINYNKTQKSKKNDYRIEGNVVIGKCFNKDVEFLFDLEDFDKVKDYCWFEDGHGYVNARDKELNKTVKMHRVVLGLDFGDETIVDHINHNGLDNRKMNLRQCDRSKNAMNAELQSNNTSGVCGVSYKKTIDRWTAYIRKDNKQHYLGSYVNFEDAVRARKRAEEAMFGEYSYDNSQSKGEENLL